MTMRIINCVYVCSGLKCVNWKLKIIYEFYYYSYLFLVCDFLSASTSFCMTRKSALLAANMSNNSSTLYLSRLFSSLSCTFCFCSRTKSLEPGPLPPPPGIKGGGGRHRIFNQAESYSDDRVKQQSCRSCGVYM